MNIEAIKCIMNPVRIKIIQELNVQKTATTKEIAQACGDIPPATLYRHLNALMKNHVIEVVSENKVRGILEKVYKLNENPGQFIGQYPNVITKEDLSAVFIQFMFGVLNDFDESVSQPEILQKIENNLGFSSATFFLTDEELAEMSQKINASIIPLLKNTPAPGRKLRKLSTIFTTVPPAKR